uniref:Uncharacterized protein n=1 Tax=Romanomermis culicivorax TaxID=13658 RepID=A0A915K993_ROMCU
MAFGHRDQFTLDYGQHLQRNAASSQPQCQHHEASPFPSVTTLQSPKICILHEVHPCGGLILNFPGEEMISSHS